jgi:hypothetical protein
MVFEEATWNVGGLHTVIQPVPADTAHTRNDLSRFWMEGTAQLQRNSPYPYILQEEVDAGWKKSLLRVQEYLQIKQTRSSPTSAPGL